MGEPARGVETPDSDERRAPVQRDYPWVPVPSTQRRHRPGTIAWSEHVEAWIAYAARYGRGQSAERIAERGGFGYAELTEFLGREPTTWTPARESRR